MVDFRHTIVNGRLRALWEPGLFAFPGVLFMWAGLVALHRLALWGVEGGAGIVYVCVGILFLAGLCLALGRAGTVVSPKEGRWGFCLGILRPLVCFWRPLAGHDRVILEVEAASGEEKAYAVGLGGEREVSLGVTTNAVVAGSVAESLATFLERPLQLKDEHSEKTLESGPFWGQTASFGGKGGAQKARTEGGAVQLPLHATSLRGRGPLLLAIFMVIVLALSWGSEELSRSFWGITAVGFVVMLCLWALPFSLNAFLRRASVRADKKALTYQEKGLLPSQHSFAWTDVVYVAVLPPKKGFLELAGRDGCVTVGDRTRSVRFGESLKGDDLVGLYRYITAQMRKGSR